MGEWFHCNTCFIQPGEGIMFHLTSCGHIYCEKCLKQTSGERRCCMCGSQYTAMMLTTEMKPEVEVYFTEPLDLVNKNLKCLKQLIQVIDFQMNHRKRFFSHLKDMAMKQASFIKKQNSMTQQLQEYEREIIKLREENSYLRRLVHEKTQGIHSLPKYSQLERSTRSPVLYRESSGRSNSSPVMVSMNSQVSQYKMSHSQTYIGYHGNSGVPGRVTIRTPPSGGKMGVIPGRTPSPRIQITSPKSVPHPIPLSETGLETPT
ncbi:hypothetical protein CHS0354_022746 [Potamilus streckersoni]|nr:hypothetical protein CHS0354_022746 [Potamilus streckersoni]